MYVNAAPSQQQTTTHSVAVTPSADLTKSSTPETQLHQAQTLAKGILKEAYKNIFNISDEKQSIGGVAGQITEPAKIPIEIPNRLLSLELAKLLTQIDRISIPLVAEKPFPSSASAAVLSSQSAGQSDGPAQSDSPTIDNLVAKLRTVQAGTDDEHSSEDLGKFPWPISGNIFSTPGSALRQGGAKWQGLLIKAEPGAEVQSIAEGKVVYAGEMKNLGLLVMIDHEDGHISLYGRNSKIFVSQGQRVKKHQKISAVDATLTNSDIGLYFEIRRNGQPIDPRLICSNSGLSK